MYQGAGAHRVSTTLACLPHHLAGKHKCNSFMYHIPCIEIPCDLRAVAAALIGLGGHLERG